MVETLTGWFKGGDIKFKEGVHQLRNINREKDKYDHVVRDKRTGKIIHEEHEKLSDHKND